MNEVGMDVSAMHHLADSFERTAKEINNLVFRVNGNVDRGILEWLGDVAVEYSQLWRVRSKLQLLAIEMHLLGLARELRSQIAAQERASTRVTVGNLGLLHLRERQSATYDNGEQRITAGPTFHGTGPGSVHDLLDPLHQDSKWGHSNDPHSVYHYAGGISVAFVGDPPNRHAIVTIAGTQGATYNDWLSNGQNAIGLTSAKEASIAEAMQQAGVMPSDKVMLVGHSLGGASAIAFSSDYRHDPRFDIESIVTVGAPDAPKNPPGDVDVLELRGSLDQVPGAGFDIWGSGSSVHRVVVPETPLASPLTWHDPGYYQQQLPNSPEIERFEDAHPGFFAGGPSTTSMYANERVR